MRTADVAIVGGGVIGCSIAYSLTSAGVTDIALLERGTLAGGATGICPGGIRQQFEGEADCRLAQRSLPFWEQINEILEPEAPFVFERSGYLFLADSLVLLERFRTNVSLQNQLGIRSRVMDSADIAALLPHLNLDGIVGGAFCADDGFLEDCHGVTHTLARRARDRGARVLYEEVLTIRREGEGWSIRTSKGELQARELILAAGADSAPLAAQAGVSLPIVAEPRRLLYTAPAKPNIMLPLVVSLERGFAGKQLSNAVFYLGWIPETPQLDNLTFIERTMSAGATLLADLADLPVRRVVTGVYDATPDHRPVLGTVGPERLAVAAGFTGHGFMIAPAVGEMIAALVARGEVDALLGSFSLDRFTARQPKEGLLI